MKLKVLLLFTIVGFFIGTFIASPTPKAKPGPKPQNTDLCNLPLAVGTKGAPIKGDYEGMQGVVAGKINDGANCAYYVKFTNKDVWNGNGVHYQSVNQDNFVKAEL